MAFLPLAQEINGFKDALGISGIGIVIVIAVLAVLAIFVLLISKVFGKKKKSAAEETAPTAVAAPAEELICEPTISAEAANETSSPEEIDIPHIPGYVVLDGVSEQDAAVIMAITSHESGIPLERLCFKSIRRLNQEPELINIEEQDAAVIMAIVSDKSGIPLNRLSFKSIKLVEDKK